jgi:hypothetical protein
VRRGADQAVGDEQPVDPRRRADERHWPA